MASPAEHESVGEAPSLERLLADLCALEEIVAAWDETPRGAARALVNAVEDLHREALKRMIRILRRQPGLAPALREAASDEVVYAVLRRHGLLRPSVQERVESALAAVRPMLGAHGGDVELVSVELPDTVSVRLLGACDGCPASMVTLVEGVEKAIREACPEITTIRRANAARPLEAGVEPVRIVSPFDPADGAGWFPVCSAEEIPEDGILVRAAAGTGLLLTRSGERVRAYRNACAHMGLALDGGSIADGIITCPHHGFRYELAEGQCLTVPGLCLPAVPVREHGGRIEVRRQ